MTWAELLELPTPPVLFQGLWDTEAVRSLRVNTAICEGYVVRSADGFPYRDFARSVAKWVRPSHVQTDDHWMHGAVVPNGLRTSETEEPS